MAGVAARVEREVESWIPCLEWWVRHGVFEWPEARAVLRQRRIHEYRVSASRPQVLDFTLAIEFELELEERRQKASSHLTRGHHYSGFVRRRVRFLFERAIRRLKGDERKGMVRWYRQHLSDQGDKQRHSALLARLLLLNPSDESLWVDSASLRSEESAEVARRLLHRGLRACPGSRAIWLELMRLELRYMDGLLRAYAEDARLCEERGQEVGEETAAERRGVLTGSLVRMVFRSAAEDLVAKGPKALVPLLEAALDYPFTAELSEELWEESLARHPSSEELQCRRLSWPYDIVLKGIHGSSELLADPIGQRERWSEREEGSAEAWELSCRREASLAAGEVRRVFLTEAVGRRSCLVWDRYSEFVQRVGSIEWKDEGEADREMAETIWRPAVREVTRCASAVGRGDEERGGEVGLKGLSAGLFQEMVSGYLRLRSANALRSSKQAVTFHPESEELWELRVKALEMNSRSSNKRGREEVGCEEMSLQCPGGIWRPALVNLRSICRRERRNLKEERVAERGEVPGRAATKLCGDTLALMSDLSAGERKEGVVALGMCAMRHCHRVAGEEGADRCFAVFLQHPPVPIELWRARISIVENQSLVPGWYERMLSHSDIGKRSAESWMDFIKSLDEQGLHTRLQTVQQRALTTLANPAHFSELYHSWNYGL